MIVKNEGGGFEGILNNLKKTDVLYGTGGLPLGILNCKTSIYVA